MKFYELLRNEQNPRWKQHYINYEELIESIYEGLEKAPRIPNRADLGSFEFGRYVASFDDAFFVLCQRELDKVDDFTSERLRELHQRYLEFESDLKHLEETGMSRQDKDTWHWLWNKHVGSEVAELRNNLKILYGDLIKLNQYLNLNYLGLRKVLKKHDRILETGQGYAFMSTKVNEVYFQHSKLIRSLLKSIELIVATVFEDGSRARAMRTLRVPPKNTKLSAWTGFQIGVLAGICVALVATMIAVGITHDFKTNFKMRVLFFRGPIVVALYLFLIGMNLYIWQIFGIDYPFIFDYDSRDHLVHHDHWGLAAFFGVAWTLSYLIMTQLPRINVPELYSPTALAGLLVAFLFNPLPFFKHRSRFWLFRTCLRIIAAPFIKISFSDFWIADQLSSLTSIFLDYDYIICVLVHGNLGTGTSAPNDDECDVRTRVSYFIILILPSVLRLIQCFRRYYDDRLAFPHLYNGLKYLLSISALTVSYLSAWYGSHIGTSSGLFYAWIVVSCVSSLYSYSWDVKMDWGLVTWTGKLPLLREDLMYARPWFYYAGLVGNVILRFTWAISLGLVQMNVVKSEWMLTVTAPAEIFRRFVWNLFRVENEQINNINEERHAMESKDDETQIQGEVDVALEERKEQRDLMAMMDAFDFDKSHWRKQQQQNYELTQTTRLDLKQPALGKKFSFDSRTELFTRPMSNNIVSRNLSEDSSMGSVHGNRSRGFKGGFK